jgi:iron complex outermembrane recepter protein
VRNPANGCVAAPALTPAVIGGQLPQAWVNYVFRPVTGITKYKEDRCPPRPPARCSDMPYGKAKAASAWSCAGQDRRHAGGGFPDRQPVQLDVVHATRGKDKVIDTFAELDVPLLANLPGAHELTANVSGRWSDYKSYGSGSTYKVGALWSPVKWFTVRATRAPRSARRRLYEQFLGATTGFLSQPERPLQQLGRGDQRRHGAAANCRSEGLPPGFQATTTSITSVNSAVRLPA